jgi:tRNA-2-methylthio-N6-dimethylallyladenosine synthase
VLLTRASGARTMGLMTAKPDTGRPGQGAETDGRAVLIETYGCQMNLYDSGVLEALLQNRGFAITRDFERADVIVLNTCAIREHAEQRVIGRLGELSRYRRDNPKLSFAVVGCMAQNLGAEITRQVPYVDYVLGPDQFFRLPEYLLQKPAGRPIINLDRGAFDYETVLPVGENAWANFVTISRGCDNICAYCVVPSTRGHQRNRPPEEIVAEVEGLAKNGNLEVTLLGQNVNAWVHRGRRFDWLIGRVSETSIRRIRFMTSHPKDMTPDIVAALAGYPKLCEHFHLPMQSGSSAVLRRMQRQYTREHYLDLIAAVRRHFPAASITTDIIVGFCGETEAEFAETLTAVEAAGFDSAFMFNYSVRPGTFAAQHLPDDVPEPVKNERLARLIELQKAQARARNQHLVGTRQEVLVDGHARRDGELLKGKTRTNKTVLFAGDDALLGQLLAVEITAADAWTLHGRCAAEQIHLHPAVAPAT